MKPLHTYQARIALARLGFLGAPPAEDRTVAGDNVRLEVLARLQATLLGRPVPILVMPATAKDDVDAADLPDGPLPRAASLRSASVDLEDEAELDLLGDLILDGHPGGSL